MLRQILVISSQIGTDLILVRGLPTAFHSAVMQEKLLLGVNYASNVQVNFSALEPNLRDGVGKAFYCRHMRRAEERLCSNIPQG